MTRSKVFNFIVLLSVMASLLFGGSSAAFAKAKTPPPPSHTHKGYITPADRKAAAKRLAQAAKTANIGAQGVSTSIIDYFGTIPNYANSPIPTTVSINGDGVGALATAVISGTVVQSVTMVANGTGYTPALTTVSIVGGGGSGAVCTNPPTIDPVTGAITAIACSGGGGYGNQPGIQKFVDSLPLINTVNDLGQMLPLAVADTTSYTVAKGFAADSDYYEIALVQYTQKLSKDLPATTLRGYVQLETPANAATSAHFPLTYPNNGGPIMLGNTQAFGYTAPQYLGPVIQAQSGRAVRVKFHNFLPLGAGGNLFLPVDTTVMGAGMGTTAGVDYSQNRAGLHLHGGNTPWISDGTPDQWTTPAGDTSIGAQTYPRGVSVKNVPDMDGGSEPTGTMTFYYTNQQSARLLFYHDHSYGITRLNVYGGAAAAYIVRDAVEQALINGGQIPGTTLTAPAGTIPVDELPLVIQDKTFVDPTTINQQDPTWVTGGFGSTPNSAVAGDLWFPHVYMPNQNPTDAQGVNAMGRWDYGPWFWPPFTGLQNGPIPNPRVGLTAEEGPVNPGTPAPATIVPEGFMDTMLVNGTTYPFVKVAPKAYRLRILNASNDRSLNLQLYYAKSNANMWNLDGTLNDANAGEVPMVPAAPGAGLPKTWPTDGRDGGVPNPASAGPAMIQIGSEGGLLPAPAPLPNTPVGFDYNRRSIVVLNVLNKTLFLGPAERADVIVDFTNVPVGSNLILYNDAPAPVPAFDPRYDYYTGDPDQTSTGGAPSTQPGYGPNTRTVLQFQVAGTQVLGFDPTNLSNFLPAAFAASQPAPIVPQTPYTAAFNPTTPFPANTARIQDLSMGFFNGPLTGLTIVNKGSGYTAAPTIAISGGATANATATTTLGGSNISAVTVTGGGVGYTTAPTVQFTGAATTPATATATITKVVNTITVTAQGTGYTSAPTVALSGGGGTGATAVAQLTVTLPRTISITVTNRGSGYTSAPKVTLSGGGGKNAAATAAITGAVKSVTLTNGGLGYGSVPTVTFTNGGATTAATATATWVPGFLASVTLTAPGAGYTSAPTIAVTGTASTPAVVTAVGVQIAMQNKAIQELFDVDYGRMNSTLGVELPNTTGVNQTTIPFGYNDPPTELIQNTANPATPIGMLGDGTQIWKITHNGVDTHAIHFHMFNVQLINRVGWDGQIRVPDANELGWKDTVRMNPLEDAIVALRPIIPNVPFKLPNSVHLMDVTVPPNVVDPNVFGVDPNNNPVTIVNQMINFGWEYVWHCHLLGHEENDMMRPMIIAVAPDAPITLTAASTTAKKVNLSWIDNSANETGFTIQRATVTGGVAGPWATIKTLATGNAAGVGGTVTYVDTVTSKVVYNYQVLATNLVGSSSVGWPTMTATSAPSNTANVTAK